MHNPRAQKNKITQMKMNFEFLNITMPSNNIAPSHCLSVKPRQIDQNKLPFLPVPICLKRPTSVEGRSSTLKKQMLAQINMGTSFDFYHPSSFPANPVQVKSSNARRPLKSLNSASWRRPENLEMATDFAVSHAKQIDFKATN